MRYPKEMIDQNKRYKIAETLKRNVRKNIPGAFEQYCYFIKDNNELNETLKVPDDHFTNEQRIYFDALLQRRKESEEVNKEFLIRFEFADLASLFASLLDK